jgi:SAM-dependent methyltransferase
MESSERGTASVPGPLERSPLLVTETHPWLDAELARLYDVFPFEEDVAAYRELAGQAGGDVLELACGTGRVALPLARAGHRVVGLDVSEHMLARARDKLRTTAPGTASRIELVAGDMRAFELGGTFGLVVVAARSFGFLLTVGEQRAALACVARHLRPGGLLALDLPNPDPRWLAEPPSRPVLDLSQEVPEDGSLVTRTVSVVSTDLASQIRVTRSEYEIVAADGAVRKRIVEWPLRWVHRFEVEHLLARAGFEVVSVSGGYHGEPYTGEGRVLFVVARRRDDGSAGTD